MRQEEWGVEVHIVGIGGQQRCRRHGQRGAHHAPDENAEARIPCGLLHGQRLGQPAGLVELDVHHVITAGQFRKARPIVRAFVGAHGNRPGTLGKHGVRSGRQGLLDHGDAKLGRQTQPVPQHVRRPGFVGIDDDLGRSRMPAHGAHTIRITFAAELHLQERTAAMLIGRPRHRVGCIEAERVGGGDGLWRGAGWPGHGRGLPALFASRSHKAQSTALRAAPAGKRL